MAQEMKLISWIWQHDAKVLRNEMSGGDCVPCVGVCELNEMLMEKV